MELQPCSIPGCGRPVIARRLCTRHYQRWRTVGAPTRGHPLDLTERPRCAVAGCERPLSARGLCQRHYAAARHAGVLRRRPPRSDEERWAALLTRNPDGCLIFGSGRDDYGGFLAQGRIWRPRRWAWQQAWGELPVNAIVKGRCRSSRCVEVRHLYLDLRRPAAAELLAEAG